MAAHPSVRHPPAEDVRPLRDIVLSIERRLSSPPARTMAYPKPLSQRARDALAIVFDDIRASGVRLTFSQLIAKANELEPHCLTTGGDINDSIRNFCAERSGLDVPWKAS